MSTDYNIVCYTCKKEGPNFAASSIVYGYKVWNDEKWKRWLGHKEDIGHHEGHDLRIVSEDCNLPWHKDEIWLRK